MRKDYIENQIGYKRNEISNIEMSIEYERSKGKVMNVKLLEQKAEKKYKELDEPYKQLENAYE